MSERAARVARGRVIVVGESTLPDVTHSVVRTDNLFDAVGEVTVATASDPIEAVVVPAAAVEGPASITVEAFRRIDPSVRLILVTTGDAAANGSDRKGFDDVIAEPVTAAQLSRLLGIGANDVSDTADMVAPDQNTTDLPDDPGVVLPEIELMPQVADLTESAELGDTDLVEAILGRPEGVRRRALALLVRQTGWPDLQLTDEPPRGGGWSSIEVRYGTESYGSLSTRQASAPNVRPWAEWLARWLALDARFREYRTMAFRDELTGAWNRRFFNRFMQQVLEKAARQRRHVTLLSFDIDDFKQFNDRFGHEAGDEVLCETVRLLNSVIRAGDRVCRIGGDEFVVIFADFESQRKVGSAPPETVEQIARRFQEQICQARFPKLGPEAPGTLSVSGGLATYPWDGADAKSLLRRADQLALESKHAGKNAIMLGSSH